MATHPPQVLFVCVHNAGRSQMAAGFLRSLGGDAMVVLSAGSQPGESLNPVAIAVMAEVGIDISGHFPRRLGDEDVAGSDVVITMGCGDECPVLPGRRYLDWEVGDPSTKTVEEVREVRDEIESRVRGLVAELEMDV